MIAKALQAGHESGVVGQYSWVRRETTPLSGPGSMAGDDPFATRPGPDSLHEPVAPSGASANVTSTVTVPTELHNHPRYRVIQLLGRGGMGAVYKAAHRLMDRMVALKIISQSLVGSQKAIERFRREVRAAARLSHPNIVTAYDAEQAGDSHFLVMELVDGISLARLVETQGWLPVAMACDFASQAAKGLQYAYECGMVHRDIKPQNLMVTDRQEIRILDFGLARFALEAEPSRSAGGSISPGMGTVQTLTQDGMMMGTPDYVAPEQIIDAHSADIRSDIYSLGCTLYYCLSGRPPFRGGTLSEKLEAHLSLVPEPLPLSQVGGSNATQLMRVVARMMARRPSDRYQTPADVIQALRHFTGNPVPREEGVSPYADMRDVVVEKTIASKSSARGDGVPILIGLLGVCLFLIRLTLPTKNRQETPTAVGLFLLLSIAILVCGIASAILSAQKAWEPWRKDRNRRLIYGGLFLGITEIIVVFFSCCLS